MIRAIRIPVAAIGVVAMLAGLRGQAPANQPPPQDGDGFRFRSGVDLINVTATVVDANGRFVPGLRQEDFVVYEDDQPQGVTHFSAERVPVSLGLVVDTSGSMAGDKIRSAKSALSRFMFDLLTKEDEIFMYRFSDTPILMQGWTMDRSMLARAVARLGANGGTALYDAVAEAIPLATQGQHLKKAIVIISDGNDTSSVTGLREVKAAIRESELLVYAVGIDGDGTVRRAPMPQPRTPLPIPMPFPGGRRPTPGVIWPQQQPQISGGFPGNRNDDRVNVTALRDLTDDSGGRTEIIHDVQDLDPATASIAGELSQQYYLGYPASTKKDGRWHTIRVEVKKGGYRVRARRGYMAT
jgi:Ca-activated chloride channel homolog